MATLQQIPEFFRLIKSELYEGFLYGRGNYRINVRSLLLQGRVKEEEKTLQKDKNASNILRQDCRIPRKLEFGISGPIKIRNPLTFISLLKKVK